MGDNLVVSNFLRTLKLIWKSSLSSCNVRKSSKRLLLRVLRCLSLLRCAGSSSWVSLQRSVQPDVTLQSSSGQLFHCHKAVLSARSSYFKVMFTLDMRERLNGHHQPALHKRRDPGSFGELRLHFKDPHNPEQRPKSSGSRRPVAVHLAQESCENFLIRVLDVDNCLGMHSFAELHVCCDLQREALRIILSRFEELTLQEEFLEVDFQKLLMILATENPQCVERSDFIGCGGQMGSPWHGSSDRPPSRASQLHPSRRGWC